MDYAIGDVHGCFDTLKKLLKKINFNPDRDRLFFLGDVINRGKKSLDTLKFIKSLGSNAKMILGNHEFHFLSTALTANKKSPKDTCNDIIESKYKNILIDYLITRPILIQYNDTLMVHAGIPPQWHKEKAIQRAREIEKQMQQENVKDFIYAMYGDNPYKESTELTKEELLRYAVNAIMRIRFCKSDGELEFKHKFNLESAPEGFKAWFEHKNRQIKTPIIFGHWSSLENIQTDNVYPMDNGCVWGVKLSAINLKNYQIKSCKSIG